MSSPSVSLSFEKVFAQLRFRLYDHDFHVSAWISPSEAAKLHKKLSQIVATKQYARALAKERREAKP